MLTVEIESADPEDLGSMSRSKTMRDDSWDEPQLLVSKRMKVSDLIEMMTQRFTNLMSAPVLVTDIVFELKDYCDC